MATTDRSGPEERPDAPNEVEDNRPSATSYPVRPALEVLVLDQRELVNVDDPRLEDRPTPNWDLRRGFPDRRAVIEWYQRATVRTLGSFADVVRPLTLVRDSALLKALLGDDSAAQARRRALEEQKLIPTTTEAYDALRAAAGEYIEVFEDDSDRDPLDFEPEMQANVAMRPGFSYLDALQQRTLAALWGGFKSDDELRDWLHDLARATNGQHETNLSKRTMTDGHAVACMTGQVGDDEHARRFRERFAIVKLLPAFAEAVQSMETGELAKRRKTTAQTYQFGQ